MPELDWEAFTNLPGAVTANWERLCGAVVRRSFGSLGSLRYVAQQPGVEFHMKVARSSTTLGEPGRWWGWQCRWYDLPSGDQIGTRRRTEILEAIRKTAEYVPGITDWVLWTRRPLTPTDQKWFREIETSMQLHLWTADDLDAHLVGEAEILRSTYFGDLILTPDRLQTLREQSIEPIRNRWMPGVHIRVEAEGEIRKVLGEPEYWPEVEEQIRGLEVSLDQLGGATTELEGDNREAVSLLADDLRDLRENFIDIASALTQRSIAGAIQITSSEWTPRLTRAEGRRLARQLRRGREHCAFAVQAGLARQHDSGVLFHRLQQYLSITSMAVVGPAHAGKTHLGAAVTAAGDSSSCGIYLEAWPLSRRGTLNELLARLDGIRAESFVQLLEAVEAAGARAGIRLPIVVDGLNESEDPASWKEELSRIEPILRGLHHVVLIVTLRPAVAQIALPDGFAKLEVQGFSRTLREDAVEAYFDEYKIDRGNVRLPMEQFSDPLFLRIFCEATNPTRDSRVAPDRVPASLTAAFIEFRRNTVRRIANTRSGVRRYEPDILKTLDTIALALWNTNRRAMPFDEIRNLIGENAEDWPYSLARALRDEGVLGVDLDSGSDARTVILFDGFAGFLIADALVRSRGRGDFAPWVREKKTAARLGAKQGGGGSFTSLIRRFGTRLIPHPLRERLQRRHRQEAHPLAPDIREAFAGLVPRRYPGMQFWELVGGDLREEAIVDSADLEGQFLDERTVAEIARLSLRHQSDGRARIRRRDLLYRLREVRDAGNHPLNAEFVDDLLSGLSVADRDLRWTEWIRNSDAEHFKDLQELIESWESSAERTDGDRLCALWLKWLLTSTVRDLRDVATLAMYWYGRGEPGALFALTLSSLNTNDPYVPERMLAASFGVMMAAPGEQREFGQELDDFIEGLWKAFCAEDATHPTDHWLIRHYVEGIAGITRRYYPDALGSHSGEWRFSRADKLESITRDDPRNSPRDLVYGLDFRNYTVGRLVPHRGNYQFDHPEYEEVSSWIRARVWDLGWSTERFAEVDRRMRDDREYRRGRDGHIELYQKKYGWVGFFEAAGRLIAEGRSPIRDGEVHLTDVDIDPSFPAKPPALTLEIPEFLSEESEDLESWVINGRVDISDELLRPHSLDGSDGPWVALSGYLRQEDIESQRRIHGFLRAVLVERGREHQLREVLSSQQHPGSFWALRLPEAHYVFAGEMTWSHCARLGLPGDRLQEIYTEALGATEENEVVIERPAHYYGWESYHSVTNEAGGYPVPAVTFAETLDLRVMPASLDWCDPEGRRASVTLAPPSDFKEAGHLLYLREDLIRDYCAAHDYEVVWIVWGERDVWFADYSVDRPEWLSTAYEGYSNVWRRIASLDEIRTQAGISSDAQGNERASAQTHNESEC